MEAETVIRKFCHRTEKAFSVLGQDFYVVEKNMKRSVCMLCIFGLCLLGATLPCTLVKAQAGSYVVQYGDTLWDIAGEQLDSPYRWREIHQQNQHIVNPNLIYPGDILGLFPDGGRDGRTAGGRRRSDKALARPWYGLPAPAPEEVATRRVPFPIVPNVDFIESSGYIAPYSLQQLQSGDFAQITQARDDGNGETTHVIRSEYGQIGLVFGDTIYINKGSAQNIREGDMFLVFRPRREIFHPVTSEIMGTQIDVLGRIRVKAIEPGIASAEIVKSYNYIRVGDPIIPVSEISAPLEKPFVGNSRSYGVKVGNQLIGHIISERINRPGVSFGDVVYIDVGAAQGVQPADNFIIFREIGEGFPRQGIGRLTVLSVQKQTSTALVTESVKTIDIGEKVVLKR